MHICFFFLECIVLNYKTSSSSVANPYSLLQASPTESAGAISEESQIWWKLWDFNNLRMPVNWFPFRSVPSWMIKLFSIHGTEPPVGVKLKSLAYILAFASLYAVYSLYASPNAVELTLPEVFCVCIFLHLHNLSFFSICRYRIAIVIVFLFRFFAPSFRFTFNIVFLKDILIHIQSIIACRSIQGYVLQQLVRQNQAAHPLGNALFVHI